jgi:hydrogenase large subunit
MVRGLENIVKGRNPKDVWAFVQRTCGVCTSTHAIASIRSVENALGIHSAKCRDGKKYNVGHGSSS